MTDPTPWPWEPDWSAGITERLEWLTDVLPAYRGEEQRRGLRLGPRQSLEFTVTAQGRARAAMEAALWGAGASTWLVPLWYDGLELSADLPAGSGTIAMDTLGRGYAAGGSAMLIGPGAELEVVEVSAVSASALTLSAPTSAAWPAGSRVFPARPAYLDGSVSLPRFDGATATARLGFNMTEPEAWPESAGAITYRGLPVLTLRPNWTSDPVPALERKLERLDAGVGLVALKDQAGLPLTSQAVRWTFTSRAELSAYRSLLHALKGRLGAVWMPSYAQDLTLAAPMSSATTAMDVERIGYTEHYALDPNRRDLRIELADGSVLFRRINAAAALDADTERLTLDAPLGVAVSPDSVRAVSFLSLVRQASDAAELAYWTGDIADAAGTFRTFRHDL